MQDIYLDHSATTPVRPEAAEITNHYMTDQFGNPSSVHTFGKAAHLAMERARQQIADAVNASPAEIVFTSGGTESDNLAIIGAAYRYAGQGRHLITSAIEHEAVLAAFKFLEAAGFELTVLPVDAYGMVVLADIEAALRRDTILLSVMHANNEVGTIQPITEIGRLAKKNKTLFHVDAVGSFGKIPVDVEEFGADLLSASSHKIYGPKGTGFLYIREGVELRPLFYGGKQEGSFRPGTENLPGIAGMGLAAELAIREMAPEMQRQAGLRDRLQKGLQERIPQIKINGHPERRVACNVNIAVAGLKAADLLAALDEEGIAASSASACSAPSAQASHVLMAMGLDKELAQGALRLTLGRKTTGEEIDYALKIIPAVVADLRSQQEDAEAEPDYGYAPADCPCNLE
ncbi:MAG: cysteine desulfurase family protein [Clostridia bacterium]|jgi:cysteine desulfurase|nr:cysteine desulfurase family protein [Clostridia bacterium]